MAGMQSQAMTKALLAVTQNKLTPTEAAKKYGIKVNSIYRRPVYKEWRAAQRGINA